MEYISYKDKVMAAMQLCQKEYCVGVGTLAVAEVRSITPVGKKRYGKKKGSVDPGHLKRSIVSDVMAGNVGVYIGSSDAPYAETVEKGYHGQKAHHYLENGCNKAIPKIINVATDIYRKNLGG
jgi:HK97 gp10 family phage protein